MSDAIAAIKDWVIRGKKNEAVAATREALEAGVDPGAIMKDGLIAAMSVVGEKYSSGEFFLPQMMIAARAMTEVVPVLKPHLIGEAAETKGKAVIEHIVDLCPVKPNPCGAILIFLCLVQGR